MSLLKDTVVNGIYYNSIGVIDYTIWSKIMLDYFGPEIEKDLKDIRKWSVAIPSSMHNSFSEKLNCWEFMGCGLENNGKHINTNTGDACPACLEKKLEGIHGGKNAGRACWIVLNTMCCGEIQETYEDKCKVCVTCDFYRTVKEEEEKTFIDPYLLKEML